MKRKGQKKVTAKMRAQQFARANGALQQAPHVTVLVKPFFCGPFPKSLTVAIEGKRASASRGGYAAERSRKLRPRRESLAPGKRIVSVVKVTVVEIAVMRVSFVTGSRIRFWSQDVSVNLLP